MFPWRLVSEASVDRFLRRSRSVGKSTHSAKFPSLKGYFDAGATRPSHECRMRHLAVGSPARRARERSRWWTLLLDPCISLDPKEPRVKPRVPEHGLDAWPRHPGPGSVACILSRSRFCNGGESIWTNALHRRCCDRVIGGGQNAHGDADGDDECESGECEGTRYLHVRGARSGSGCGRYSRPSGLVELEVHLVAVEVDVWCRE